MLARTEEEEFLGLTNKGKEAGSNRSHSYISVFVGLRLSQHIVTLTCFLLLMIQRNKGIISKMKQNDYMTWLLFCNSDKSRYWK